MFSNSRAIESKKITILVAICTSVALPSNCIAQDKDETSPIGKTDATEDLIQGYFALGGSNPQKAAKHLESAVAKNPGVVQAYVGLGDALDGLNRHDRAFAQYKKAIATDKTYMRSYWQCARTLNRSKRFKDAIVYCNKGMAINNRYTLLHMYRGDAHAGLHKDQLAVDDYTSVLKLSPRQVKALLRRAFIYMRMKKFQQAVEDCSECIKMKPKAPEGYIMRRTAYMRMGRDDLAKKDEESIRRLDKTMQSVEDIFGQF